MADDGQLKTWVSNKLMSLMGSSRALLVLYVIRLSKESTSPSNLISKLIEHGLPSSAETRSFAEVIYDKVPHNHSSTHLKKPRMCHQEMPDEVELNTMVWEDPFWTRKYRIHEAYDQGVLNREKLLAAVIGRNMDPGAGDGKISFAIKNAWIEYQLEKAIKKFCLKDKKQVADEYDGLQSRPVLTYKRRGKRKLEPGTSNSN